MDTDLGKVQSQDDIMRHVTDFYKNLFGSKPTCNMRLADSFWHGRKNLSTNMLDALIRPFTELEVKHDVDEMKSNSAPGPNGFGVQFFKTFWSVITGDLLAMFDDFYKGELDIKRLNYGVITLVPKVKEANNIRQYHPICLLNVDFKVFAKVLNNRFTPIAEEVIGGNQSGFIKGGTS